MIRSMDTIRHYKGIFFPQLSAQHHRTASSFYDTKNTLAMIELNGSLGATSEGSYRGSKVGGRYGVLVQKEVLSCCVLANCKEFRIFEATPL